MIHLDDDETDVFQLCVGVERRMRKGGESKKGDQKVKKGIFYSE
jgi:hypothetical protein